MGDVRVFERVIHRPDAFAAERSPGIQGQHSQVIG